MWRALSTLGFDVVLEPDAPPTVRELNLANALAGAAEACVLGAEIESMTGADAAVQAEEVADEVVHGALPEEISPLLVQQFRAERLERSLTRAAGGTVENPADPVLAAARDAAMLATLLITYRHSAERMEPELPEDFLQLASAALRSCEERLRGLT